MSALAVLAVAVYVQTLAVPPHLAPITSTVVQAASVALSVVVVASVSLEVLPAAIPVVR
jgi:hypothetical protein